MIEYDSKHRIPRRFLAYDARDFRARRRMRDAAVERSDKVPRSAHTSNARPRLPVACQVAARKTPAAPTAALASASARSHIT